MRSLHFWVDAALKSRCFVKSLRSTTSPEGQRLSHAFKSALWLSATPVIAAVATGAGLLALGQSAWAAPLEVTYQNTIYSLEITRCFAPGTILSNCRGANDFRASSWFGNSQLAKNLSEATKDLLGLPNSSLGTGLGPNFAWQSGNPAINNSSALPFDGFEWDPVLNLSYSRGGLWNTFTGEGTSRTFWLASETAPPKPLVVIGPILAANNGNSINTTASLAAKTVLPQFQGGTLMVSAAGTVPDNFSVDGSFTNAIDAAGKAATFSGIFSDQAGLNGNLNFINSGSSAAVISLTNQSTYSGFTAIGRNVALVVNGSTASDVLVGEGGTLGGNGVIKANVFNFGTVSPGQSIGTLTIEGGSFLQDKAGTLAIEVAGAGQSDLLQLKGAGSGQTIFLEGNLLLSSYQGAAITPGIIYTAVSVPSGTVGGDPGLSANTGGVAGTSGYRFVRDEDPDFRRLANGSAVADPNKLQFGWIQLQPSVSTPSPADVVSTTTPPGKPTIDAVKPTGGALTLTITGITAALLQQCTLNTGNASACQSNLTVGGSSGASGSTPNNITVAKAIDAGMSSVYAAVNQGSSGGASIPTVSGGASGYTTNHATQAAVTPDFVTVYGALFSVPNRAQLNQALHSITAEPYASMQSVALDAMEQFRQNSLALGDGNRAIRLFREAEVCRAEDGREISADSDRRPSTCQPRKVSQASRWSLLIDATNSQANLDGTDQLASLDYNIFQSIYGLQYDASKQWSIAAAFGYGQANLYNYQYANSLINSDTYGVSVWGVYRPSVPWKLTGLIGYTNFQFDSNRVISFGGLNRTAKANWSGNGFTTALEAEYDWVLSANKSDRNAVRLKPNTYVAYSLNSQGEVTESGAQSLNLAIAAHTADAFVYGIGFTLETPIQLAKSTRLIPRLSLGYEYDFNANSNEEHQVSASFAEVPALGSLDVLGQSRGANDLNVALNLELETSDAFSFYAGVGGSFWSNGNALNFSGGLRWRFGGAPKTASAKAGLPAQRSDQPLAPPTTR